VTCTPSSAKRTYSRRLDATGGFTLVEVLAAMLMSIVALGALAVLFASGNDASLASQMELAQTSVLQQQVEVIRQTVKQNGFSALALTSNPPAPTHSFFGNSSTYDVDPNDFITGYGTSTEAFMVESDYSNNTMGVITGTPSTGEPLLVNGTNGITGGMLAPVKYVDLVTGIVSTVTTAIPSADAYTTINTYVTQDTTVGCNTALNSSSGCSTDARRVVMAARVNVGGGRQDIGGNEHVDYVTTTFVAPIAADQTSAASGLTILGLIP
jgi:type II secretory pathway pseudopilin PulG